MSFVLMELNFVSGNDPNLLNRIQNPFYLSRFAQTFLDVSEVVKTHGPWSGAWVGESGGAYNSGGKDVSRTFVDGFWYKTFPFRISISIAF